MNKPQDVLEAEFNKNGIFFLPEKTLTELKQEHTFLSLDVEIAVIDQPDVTAPDFSISIVNRREVAILFTDWELAQRGDQTVLKFKASQRVVPGVYNLGFNQGLYMSFLDLCFFAGNEAIPEVYGEDVITNRREGVKAFDLGWFLPSRFIDPFIDAMGKLDNTILGGNAQQAILYGPEVTT